MTVTATLASVKRLLERAFAEGAVQHGVYTSLLSKLNAAEAGAPGALRAFINELRAVRGETVTPVWADRLIANGEHVAR
ncbi:MAG TPA: hypothetical protein VGF40_17545 [Thermoanaerobaculia bacterium]